MTQQHPARFAHAYVSNYGMALVDIPPRSKAPIHDDWQKPGGYFTDATAAARHWQDRPDRNMGVVLGPSRLCSLDLDELEHSKAFFSSFGVDLDKWAQDFPTIQGKPGRFRILFRVPDDVTLKRHALNWPRQEDKRKKMCIFELRGGDVQDVLPPSIHPDTKQPYIWLTSPNGQVPLIPKLLLDMWMNWDITKREGQAACPWAEKPTQQPRASRPRLNGNGSVIHAFNQAHSITDMLSHHGYKQIGVRWLSPHSSTGMPGIHVFDNNTLFCHHGSDPLCSEHARDCFDVFCELEHSGDVRQAVKAAAELLGLDTQPRQELPDLSAYEEQPGQPIQQQKEQLIKFEDLPPEEIFRRLGVTDAAALAEQAQPPEWIVKGILDSDCIGFMGGKSGGMKTFVAMELMHCIATGRPFFGHEIKKPGPVLYLCGEGDGGLGRRFKGIEKKHGPAPDLHVIPRSKQLDAVYLHKVKTFLKLVKPVLIVVDTWNQLSHEVNNNNASEVSIQLAQIRQTVYASGVKSAGLIVHHLGKDEEKGLEGSHAFTSNSDFEFLVKKDSEEEALRTCLICKKQKDGEHFKAIFIQGEVIDTGLVDEDGKPVRTLVLKKAPPSLAARAETDEPETRTSKGEMLRAFRAIADEQRATCGRSGPMLVRLVDVKQWLALNSKIKFHTGTVSRLVQEGLIEASGRGEYTVI